MAYSLSRTRGLVPMRLFLRRPLPASLVVVSALAMACAGVRGTEGEAGRVDAATAPASWIRDAYAEIGKREYHASDAGKGLQAPNRRQRLRFLFDESGLRVTDRMSPSDQVLATIRLTAWGRPDALRTARPGTLESDGPRVELARVGLIEWFENGREGLEHGFDVRDRPLGEGPLVLDLEVLEADVTAHGVGVRLASRAGRSLDYGHLVVRDAIGVELAARLEVPSASRVRFVVEDGSAVYPLMIDPLLSAAFDTQLDGAQVDARFGSAVSAAGDVDGDGFGDVIIGAPDFDAGEAREGAAFVFYGSTTGIASGGTGTAPTQLESDQAIALFGSSVASAGDVNGDGYDDVIAGAPQYDAGESNEGAAFVFLGGAGGIPDGDPGTAHARLESNQAAGPFFDPGPAFGTSVSGAGDVNGDGYADVIVGAIGYDDGQSDEGAAFVFLGSAAGIANGDPTTAHAQLESNQTGSEFGSSVASAGDVNGDGYDDVIVGSTRYSNAQINEGGAFVFLGSAAGISDGSPASAHATIEGNQTEAQLGRTVDGAGDVNGDGYADVIVGAWLYEAAQNDEGVALVFLGGPTGIQGGTPQTADTLLQSNETGARMGRSVAGAGDVNGDGYADVIVGAELYDTGVVDEGAAFVFLGGPAGVPDGDPSTAHAELGVGETGAEFGWAVGAAGDVDGDGFADVVVGARFFSSGTSEQGAAFVYRGGATGIQSGGPSTAHAEIESTVPQSSLGGSVDSAGDVNGDGYGDVIIGSRLFDAGEPFEGAAFVFHGGPGGLASGEALATADTVLRSAQSGSEFGSTVAGAGDVNGDGYSDVIVGASRYDDGEEDEGAAFIFLGGPSGIADATPATAHTVLQSNVPDLPLFGAVVSGVGDLNGDGYADVAVGAGSLENTLRLEGATFVYLGGYGGIPDGDPSTADAVIWGGDDFAQLPTSIGTAGDVNGDGYSDLLLGSLSYAAPGAMAGGAAFLFHGGPAGLSSGDTSLADGTILNLQAGSLFGWSTEWAGDVNGDGYDDAIVGASQWSNGEATEGAAFVFLGSAGGIGNQTTASADSFLEGNQVSGLFGSSVAGAGDVNGDGFGDVVVSAESYEYGGGPSGEGALFVFHGSAAGIPTNGSPATSDAYFESAYEGAFMAPRGSGLAAAGDVDGDGHGEIVAGSQSYDIDLASQNVGHVWMVSAEHPGRDVAARQRRGDGSGIPVQPYGLSHLDDGFEVALAASHPEGSGAVALEIEACPSGIPFADPACTVHTGTTWQMVGGATPTAVLTETIHGLTMGTTYRWRARVLHAPRGVALPGLAVPAQPTGGRWRRPTAQARSGDIRVPEPGGWTALLLNVGVLCVLARVRPERVRSR